VTISICTNHDFDGIYTVINDAATAYEGIIPADRWKDPYMPRHELRRQIEAGVRFWAERHDGRIKNRGAFDGQVRPLIGSLTGQTRLDFGDALEPIARYLAEKLLLGAKGVAIFSRAGGEPFFLPLQFRVPLPDWMAVGTTPNIFHLVELKDTYHRYVVMISTEESVRIYEVNLGAVTEQLWEQRPELRKRVGRE